MPSLKEIRTRIGTVTSTRQITAAMKMVAAARLRRAQDTITQLRPYATKMNEVLEAMLVANGENNPDPFTEAREPAKVLILVVTSNRGLCGAFNANVTRQAVAWAQQNHPDLLKNGNLQFFTLGKKGNDFMKGKKYPVLDNNNSIAEKPLFADAAPLANRLMGLFLEKKYDRIVFIYNQFKNAAVQILTYEQFLPVRMPHPEEIPPRKHHIHDDFIFEPGREKIIRELIPKTLRVQLFKILADSYAAEQGARMTAMHQATDNATELLRELRLTYNKARQATITKEILEIVGGAEALSK